jgi:hypothetical protein
MIAQKPTHTPQAQALYNMNLLPSYQTPDLLRPLTRIEATTILINTLELQHNQTNPISYFIDIADDHQSMNHVNIALDHNIATGIGEYMFNPNTLITANQFAAMILRASGQFHDNDWYNGIDILIEQEVITTENAETMDLFTLGDLAKIIYNARANGLLGV